MNLNLSLAVSKNYKSSPQIVRVVTEEWATKNLYCPVCDSNSITKALPNTPTIDFTCPKCCQTYQLKSRRDWSENKIVDAAYSTMIAAIRNDNTPNLFLLQYSPSWSVQNMLLIPHFFISADIGRFWKFFSHRVSHKESYQSLASKHIRCDISPWKHRVHTWTCTIPVAW